jgi:peptidoglycan/LPS O-acetylase OafA/YrhL
VVASALLLTSAFWPNYIEHVQSTESTLGLIALGAVMAVVAADNCRPLGAALTTRPAFWLGQVSFSLYLIHEPIIIATRFVLPDAPVAVCAGIAIALSLIAAHLFFRAIEAPSIRLSHRVKRSLSAQRVASGPTEGEGRSGR